MHYFFNIVFSDYLTFFYTLCLKFFLIEYVIDNGFNPNEEFSIKMEWVK